MTTAQDPGQQRRRFHLHLNWRTVTLVAILLVASFLRFWRLDSIPPGLNHDEAYNGLDALALLDGQTFPIFHEGWELYAQEVHEQGPVFQSKTPAFLEGNYGREPLVAYLMAASIAIGGATPIALRAIVALSGVLAVLSTYGAAQELTRTRAPQGGDSALVDIIRSLTPLLAAFIMAVYFPAILFSRYGVRAMIFVPLEGLVVYLFWRGERAATDLAGKNGQQRSAAYILGLAMTSPRWFAAAGLVLGISLYSYGAARFFPFVFVAFVPIWLWRNKAARRRHLGDVALMATTAVVVAIPMLLYLARHPYYAIYRSRVVANRGAGTYPGRPWLTWANNTWKVFAGMLWRGDQNLLHNLPGRPLLDPLQALLAVAGLVRIALGGLNWRHIFLVIWLLVMVAPSLLTGDAPHFARLIGLALPLVIVIAMGGTWLVELVAVRTASSGDRASMAALAALMVLLLASAFLSIRDYFGRYAAEPELAKLFAVDDWQLGQYAAALPEDEIIYLSPTQQEMATIYFAMKGNREQIRSYYSPNGTLVPAGSEGEGAFYLVRPRAASAIDLLARRFPQGSIDLSYPIFTAFMLPGEVSRFATEGDPLSWGGAIALHEWSAVQVGDQLIVTLVWEAKVEMERSYTAYVHLLSQDGQLVAQLDRLPDGYPTSDWQPGEIVIDSYAIQLPPNVTPGTHYLQTGFYFLPTQERLGEPAIFGDVQLER